MTTERDSGARMSWRAKWTSACTSSSDHWDALPMTTGAAASAADANINE